MADQQHHFRPFTLPSANAAACRDCGWPRDHANHPPQAGRQTTPEPYMKRNPPSGFWPVRTPQEKYGPGRESTPEGWPEELLQACVAFWCCPVHVGAPHRVEWREGVAYCLTDGCGRTSASARESSATAREQADA